MEGKVILITGSSQGIGKETALKFAKEKARVVITYNNSEEEARNTEEECKALASEVLVVKLDIGNDEDIKNAVKEVVDKFGKIDILVNNAGWAVQEKLENSGYENIEKQLRINVEGLIKMTKECLPHIKDCIINIGSGIAKKGFGTLAVYSATKFAVRGFTQALSQEVDFDVFCVNPGLTATKLTNFKGTPAEKVGEIILKTAKREYGKSSGQDIDVWEYV